MFSSSIRPRVPAIAASQVGGLTLEQLEAGLDFRVLLDGERVDGAQLVEPATQRREATRRRRLARGRLGRPRAGHRVERRGEGGGLDVGIGFRVICFRIVDRGIGLRRLHAPEAGHLTEPGESQRAESGQLHEELLAQRVQGETGLESSVVGGAQPLVRGAQPLAGTGRGTLGSSQPFPIGRVRGADLVHRRSCGLLACRGSRELGPDPISLVLEQPLPLTERGRLAVRPGDPFVVHGERRLCPRMVAIGLTTLGIERGNLHGEPVTPRPQFGDACLPRSDGPSVRWLVAIGAAGACRPPRGPVKGLERRACPGGLGVEPLGLGLVPAALAEPRFVIPNGDPLHVLGPLPRGGGLRLLVAPALGLLAGGGRGVRRCRGSCLECARLGLDARDVRRQPLGLRAPLEQALARGRAARSDP